MRFTTVGEQLTFLVLTVQQEISGCLLGEEDDGHDIAEAPQTAIEAKDDFFGISGCFIFKDFSL